MRRMIGRLMPGLCVGAAAAMLVPTLEAVGLQSPPTVAGYVYRVRYADASSYRYESGEYSSVYIRVTDALSGDASVKPAIPPVGQQGGSSGASLIANVYACVASVCSTSFYFSGAIDPAAFTTDFAAGMSELHVVFPECAIDIVWESDRPLTLSEDAAVVPAGVRADGHVDLGMSGAASGVACGIEVAAAHARHGTRLEAGLSAAPED